MYQAGDRCAIPALGMLAAPEEELNRRAAGMIELIGDAGSVIRGAARAGGGTLPLLELEGRCALSTLGPVARTNLLRPCVRPHHR